MQCTGREGEVSGWVIWANYIGRSMNVPVTIKGGLSSYNTFRVNGLFYTINFICC